jgi:hypothetical protein
MPVLGLATTYQTNQLKEAGLVLSSLEAITLDQICRLLERHHDRGERSVP